MKILTKEEIDAHYHATIRGGIKGMALGLGTSLPLSFLAHRRWHYYRSLPLALKAFGVVIVSVPACVIWAEHEGLVFERQNWHDRGKEEIDAVHLREQMRWEGMDQTEKMKDWASRHRYGIIGGSWALSMAGSFGIIMRDKYMTFPQKIVQARMWAQGLTIAVLLASTMLSSGAGQRHVDKTPGSWRSAIHEEMDDQKARAEATQAKHSTASS